MCLQFGGERHELDHAHGRYVPDRLASSSFMQGVEQNAGTRHLRPAQNLEYLRAMRRPQVRVSATVKRRDAFAVHQAMHDRKAGCECVYSDCYYIQLRTLRGDDR